MTHRHRLAAPALDAADDEVEVMLAAQVVDEELEVRLVAALEDDGARRLGREQR
ncbi:hypothetical protein OV079_08405 [Nannocystis pusilla]|uniref:Uncharacterized protein n=1 Tax=Nannocystis pusilla TaxID=889268 RepID=A0A9X3EK71_9BACT|nr:hypothetical protein [Nannocystis pusilla]MCY1005588.1 hypothetical protein [Nannocystis pusilla]